MTLVSTDRSVRALLKQGIEQFRAANVPSYTLAAELLSFMSLRKIARGSTRIPKKFLPSLLSKPISTFCLAVRPGVPTQHLTGKQEFWGLEFEVTPDVLIPRPETEHLIEVALDRLAVRELRAGRQPRLTGENVTIVDIGTGSGCLAITLAKELSAATVYATDISAAALAIARRNAARHNLAERIHFLQSNLLEAFLTLPVDARHAAPMRV